MDTPFHGVPFPARDQLELHQELHARPALPARPGCVVSYWVSIDMAPERAEQALATLCLACGHAAPPAGVRHHVLHAPEFALKYERHGEFVSWQLNRPLPQALAGAAIATTTADGGARAPEPAPEPTPDNSALDSLLRDASALRVLPDAFVALLSGEGAGRMLAATHVLLLDARQCDDMLPRCQALLARQAGQSAADDAGTLMGAFIGDSRRAALLTHLRLGTDGFTRFVVLDFGMPPDQAAREAQRLCEIEAYRMLAMRGFPVAQRESALLATLEQTLQGTVDAMANDGAQDDTQAFEVLTRLAAEVEHSTARTRYRFSATRAYHRIVERRLADLREQRIEGVQTLSGFLSRRFAPAMALCESTDSRLTDIAERINRATSLARVRIEVRREEGNQQLLRALAKRQRQQLQLQQTVEGLSVVAISYYTLGLVGYLAKAAKTANWLEPLHLQPDAVVGLAVLPVLGGVAWFVQKLRKHLE